MRVVLLTQDEPFYLAENINYLIKNLPKNVSIVSAILFDASPFGKKETFWNKAYKTYSLFGIGFFIHYGYKFLLARLNKKKSVPHVLKNHGVTQIRLAKNINDPESLEIINSFNPDLLISIAGNQIFKSKLINLAPKGCLNLHTALLPKYRGLMPSFWVLKNNEKETGVSVFFVDEGIDSGPILVQKKVIIGNMSQEQLIKHTKLIGMDAINEAIQLIISNKYSLIVNNELEKTYFSFPTRKDVKEFRQLGKRFF